MLLRYLIVFDFYRVVWYNNYIYLGLLIGCLSNFVDYLILSYLLNLEMFFGFEWLFFWYK